MAKDTTRIPFTGYQKFVIFILAITQFSVILDFLIMSPLGDVLMKSLNITTKQFGIAVAAYAFSAGISGLLSAGFADKYDRKNFLLFFYGGFILGTLFCGLAPNFHLLVAARIITGIFGGVIGSISMAILADVFDIHHRGRVMGIVQMGFGAAQVLGLPLGIYLANNLGWHSTFLMIVILATIVTLLIAVKLQPVNQHLATQNESNPLKHFWNTIKKRDYRIGFASMALLSLGGFMMMPFGTAFAINNLQILPDDVPKLMMVSGCASLVIMPIMGRLSDKIDKFVIFTFATLWMIGVVVLYTHLSTTPLWQVMIFNVCMMMGILSRAVPSGALIMDTPVAQDRGAFMSLNSSLQQIAGGIAAVFAGYVVVQKSPGAPLEHYDTLGYIISGICIVSIFMLCRVSVIIKSKLDEKKL